MYIIFEFIDFKVYNIMNLNYKIYNNIFFII